jgi:uncharacterized protein YaaQ
MAEYVSVSNIVLPLPSPPLAKQGCFICSGQSSHRIGINTRVRVLKTRERVSNTLAPVSKTHERVSNTLAPVSKTHERVLNTLAPVLKTRERVLNTLAPVLKTRERVLNTRTPVSKTRERVLNTRLSLKTTQRYAVFFVTRHCPPKPWAGGQCPPYLKQLPWTLRICPP